MSIIIIESEIFNSLNPSLIQSPWHILCIFFFYYIGDWGTEVVFFSFLKVLSFLNTSILFGLSPLKNVYGLSSDQPSTCPFIESMKFSTWVFWLSVSVVNAEVVFWFCNTTSYQPSHSGPSDMIVLAKYTLPPPKKIETLSCNPSHFCHLQFLTYLTIPDVQW